MRLLGWLWVAMLLGTVGLCAWSWASGTPEHVDWRYAWREPPLVFWPAQWAEFPLQPNLLTFRGAHLGLVHLVGVGFERLWLVAVGLVLLCAAGLARLARESLPRGGGPWFLGGMLALLLSPAFGANWLIAERFRVVLPAALFVGAVVVLQHGIATRRRVLLAGVCAGLALTTHDSGALAWLALAPMVAMAALRGGRRPWAYVAGWALAFNVLALCVWDEVYVPAGGLGVHLREHPLELGLFLLRSVGLVLPEPLPGLPHGHALMGALAFGTLALVSVCAWRGRGDGARVQRSCPWLACAWFGALAAVALAHRHFPCTLPELYLREILWPVLFLPIGIVGAAAGLWPDFGARARGPLLALLVVLGAQQWWVGFDDMAVKGRVLRQNDALVTLAELDGLLGSPSGPLPLRADRDYLRGLGRMPLAMSIEGDDLLALPRVGQAGSAQRVEATVVHGMVESRTDFVCDLVLLVQKRAAGADHVVALARPTVIAPLGVEPFAVDLRSFVSFAAGDELWAVALDARRRQLAPMAGRFVFRDGGFVAAEAGR